MKYCNLKIDNLKTIHNFFLIGFHYGCFLYAMLFKTSFNKYHCLVRNEIYQRNKKNILIVNFDKDPDS